MTRWQFSVRALLILTTLVAAVAAFTANYPLVAMLLGLGTLWVLFESGAIADIVLTLSKPAMYERHPYLAVAIGLVAGAFSFAICGVFWQLFRGENGYFAWISFFAAMFVALFGVLCFRLIWLPFKGPAATETHKRQTSDSNSV
jgi:hypothetical protein